MKERFSLRQRIASFRYAWNGIKVLYTEEHNARIHVLAAVLALVAGVVLEINRYEWLAIVIAIGFVLVAETINTAIENIADYISPSKNEKIKVIKDLSATAVLLSVIVALIVGILVFVPRLLDVFVQW
jgi:diacylglycerol kinase